MESIAATSPAPNVPVRSSVPPEAVMVSAAPVPAAVRFAATVPKPLSVPLDVVVPKLSPEASVSVPPAITMVPPVTFCAAPIVRLPLEIFSVWLAAVHSDRSSGGDPAGKIKLQRGCLLK